MGADVPYLSETTPPRPLLAPILCRLHFSGTGGGGSLDAIAYNCNFQQKLASGENGAIIPIAVRNACCNTL